ASSGIGQATAEMLVDRGARVTIFARSAEKLKTIAGRSKNLLDVGGDIGDPAAVDRLFAETESRFGSCDILINNAGTYVARRLEKMSVGDWDSVFQVNLRGPSTARIFMSTVRDLRPTWAEIDLGAFTRNVDAVMRRLPQGSKLIAVLKADAYGHGAVELARRCSPDRVAMIATALLEEALELRAARIALPLLVLG